MTLTVSTIKSVGYKARDEHAILGSLDLDGQNVRGCCIEITRFIEEILINRHGISSSKIRKIRCDFLGEEMHYIVSIDADVVQGVEGDEGEVYIDASVDQFCTEQEEIGRVDVSIGNYDELPRVDIIEPTSDKKERYQNEVRGV